MAAITIRGHTLSQFVAELRAQAAHLHRIEAVMLHHTWSPNAAQFRGLSSIQGIQRYHMAHGFSCIAANAYSGTDGLIYNGRPLSYSNWAHAAVEKAWSSVSADARAIAGGNRMWFNHHAFGIETVGNFDSEDPAGSRAMSTSLDLTAAILTLCRLGTDRIFFHRDVANKSCPGNRVSKTWVREQVAARMAGDPGTIMVKVIERQSADRLFDIEMVPHGWHPEQRKLYIERVVAKGGRKLMAKGTPKKDGSGGGTRANRGRGGCKTTKTTGQGRSKTRR